MSKKHFPIVIGPSRTASPFGAMDRDTYMQCLEKKNSGALVKLIILRPKMGISSVSMMVASSCLSEEPHAKNHEFHYEAVAFAI